MTTEIKKRPVAASNRASYFSSVPLAAWCAGNHVKPSGCNFLEWIINEGLILVDDCSMMQLLGWGVLGAFQEARATGHYDPRLFDRRTPPWLRMGDYRLCLSMDGASLTVQQGRRYGHFIDTRNFDGDWLKVGAGLEAFGIRKAPYPASPGRVAAGLLNDLVNPRNVTTPLGAFNLAWEAAKGSRMEALTLGTVEGVAYDISSAFPFAASNLPWAQCRWVESREHHDDAYYGFARIEADIPSDLPAGPLAFRIADAHQDEMALTFPTGKITVTASQPEMQLLKDMGIQFKIKQGWWGYPVRNIYPFEELMQMLWDLREYDKPGAKALSVAAVGQLGSVIDGVTYQGRSHFNPVYFAHIYADTRCRVYRKALEAGLDNVCAFTIDGIIALNHRLSDNGVPDVYRADSVGFGLWRIESEGAFFLANDYFKDRPGDDGRWRQAVAGTPPDVPQSRFEATLDTYVGVTLAMDRPDLRAQLGGSYEVLENLPLGSDHRTMPKGVRRQDFLDGAIETKI